MNVVFFGGGGYALELYSYIIDDIKISKKSINVIGVYDAVSDCELLRHYPELTYLGSIDEFKGGDFSCLITIGNPISRALVHKIISPYADFFTYIHSSAIVSSSASIGMGVIIGPQNIISAKSSIGDNVCLNVFCGVGHGTQILESSVLGPYSLVNGDCSIGKACYLGTKVAIFPSTKIGNGVSVDAGSVVRNNIDDFTLCTQRVEQINLPNRIIKKSYFSIYE